ncbi:MAG TPA: preprotein translocase subunit SecY [Fimbriimonadales bacterium]|nr:preprotein translocase subunit SecY [Fimbriimonadales bacterium]
MNFVDVFRAAWNEPDLRQRILFIFLIFGIYAIGIHIQVPIGNIDPNLITQKLQQSGVLEMINMFTGGALRRLSIFALGLNPYITASIIMQLVTVAIPSLKKEMMEGGQYERMRRAQRTRALTLVLCAFQGWGFLTLLTQGIPLSAWEKVQIVVLWTAGAMFVLWLGEQIQEKGIGQGVSLMIFAGIVVSFPIQTAAVIQQVREGTMAIWRVVALFGIFVLLTGLIVFFTQAQRRIMIQHMRRTAGAKMLVGGSSYLPIPVNAAGVIPIIFAVTLLYLPAQIAQWFPPGSWMGELFSNIAIYFNPRPGAFWYQWLTGTIIYALLIFFFTYFYTAVQYNVEEIAGHLKRSGAYIPGVRQGKQTEQFLDQVISRITAVGAFFLAFVSLVPYWIPQITGVAQFSFLGSTSLLIIVSVVLDLMRQIEANLIMKGYSRA